VARERQKMIQLELALRMASRGEAPKANVQGTELDMAESATESPASSGQLMEEICQRDNLIRAWKRVKSNRGSPGVDGITVEELKEQLNAQWPEIREQLLAGSYKPQPVKRVEIPKPGGGKRQLGIPIPRSHCTSYNGL
jgi:RNA-directed DNA polymerase